MNKLLFFIVFVVGLVACEKGPGEGGRAKITGTLMAVEYNKDFSFVSDTFPAAEADVYIIYGDDEDAFYGDRVKVDHNGTFEFDYLREGEYVVYAYSKDTSLVYDDSDERIAVFRNLTISSKKQELNVDTIYIAK